MGVDASKNSLKEHQEKTLGDLLYREYLSIAEVGEILGISRQWVYETIYSGARKASKLSSQLSIVHKADVETMLAEHPYTKRTARSRAPITEFYITEEIKEKFGVSHSYMFDLSKRIKLPNMRHRGKMLWNKKHIDAHFAEQRPNPSVAEWILAEELTSLFDVPKQTTYDLAYENQIIKRKQGSISFYDKQAMLQALERRKFGDEAKEAYYTITEVMAKYGLTYRQISTLIRPISSPARKWDVMYGYDGKISTNLCLLRASRNSRPKSFFEVIRW